MALRKSVQHDRWLSVNRRAHILNSLVYVLSEEIVK